jgi:hypothetical protein
MTALGPFIWGALPSSNTTANSASTTPGRKSTAWVVYSVGTIATNQVCPKAGTLSPITIKSGQSVTVKAGCNIPTMDHLISADHSEDMEIVISWLDWTMSLSQLFNHDDNAQLTAMITGIRKHINGDFDASQLLKRLDNVQKPFSADHWRFSSPAAMLKSCSSHSCGFVCCLEEMLYSGTSNS